MKRSTASFGQAGYGVTATPRPASVWLAVVLLLPQLAAADPAGPGNVRPPAEVTFASLLREMVDRDALARFPHPEYQQGQASSYNRASVARDQPDQTVNGWFADSDGIGFVREEPGPEGKREWVVLDEAGPGCLTKFWTVYFHRDWNNRVGPRVRIYLDGASTPVLEERLIELLTRNAWSPRQYGPVPPRQNRVRFPSPFADFTARAGNLYVPIPFARHCKVTLDEPPFYHLLNYRRYAAGTAVRTFDLEQYRAAEALLAKVGAELLTPGGPGTGWSRGRAGTVGPERPLVLRLPGGSAALRELQIRISPDDVARRPQRLRSTVLRLAFDDQETVWCPLGDFFGSANALNPFHTWSRTVRRDGTLTVRWVMPYRKRAVVTLQAFGSDTLTAEIRAVVRPWKWDDRTMHFHARWRPDEIQRGDRFVDWNFVNIRGQGVFVGDQWTVLNPTDRWWGEGDEKIYVNEAYEVRKFPDHFGTGTEDYYGWAGGEYPRRKDVFSHPFLANITVGSTPEDSTRGFNILTRQRGLDAIPFTRRLVFDMEASPGTDQRGAEDRLGYSAVTFWYALPGATCNRPPMPSAAARPLLTFEDLRP